MRNNKINQAGFSILEMTAVIAIIGLTIVGLMSLALQSIQVQRLNKYNLTAAMLAQEGIEIVRNRRDSNWRTRTDSWTTVMAADNYIVDYNGTFTGGIGDIDNSGAVLNIAGGFYEHGVGVPSPFSRLVTISNTTAASSTVTSRVRYRSGDNYFNYIAETVLYDWNQ